MSVEYDFLTGGLKKLAIASTRQEVDLLIRRGFKIYFSPDDATEYGMDMKVFILGIPERIQY